MAKKATQKEKPTKAAQGRRSGNKKAADSPPVADPMSQCVALCQEQRWRDALLLCRQTCENKGDKIQGDIKAGLQAAQVKIDRSLRRQMAFSLVEKAAELLHKEYLLDVSE